MLLGSTAEGAAVNFAVRSRAATAMSLCLARQQPGGKTGYLEVSPATHARQCARAQVGGPCWNVALHVPALEVTAHVQEWCHMKAACKHPAQLAKNGWCDETSGPLASAKQVALDAAVNRTGDMWHVCLEGLKDLATLSYGWRADAADISQFYPGWHLQTLAIRIMTMAWHLRQFSIMRHVRFWPAACLLK